MTTLTIEFYCFIACVIGFPIALVWGVVLWRKLRRSRASLAHVWEAHATVVGRLVTATERADSLHIEAEKWKGRAKACEKSGQLLAKRLHDAQTDLDALKHPPRGERGRFASKAKVAAK